MRVLVGECGRAPDAGSWARGALWAGPAWAEGAAGAAGRGWSTPEWGHGEWSFRGSELGLAAMPWVRGRLCRHWGAGLWRPICLLGGGTGFVGTALTQLLRSRGHEVTHVSRQAGKDRISWVWEESGHRRGCARAEEQARLPWPAVAYRGCAVGILGPVGVLLASWVLHGF